jgi:alpha-galactosidase
MMKYLALALLFTSFSVSAQKFDNLAQTPPMGWNSWNTFQTKINVQLVKDIADAFISQGLKDAGYTYIVLDDGWMAHERDAQGNLVPDPEKFPDGLKPVIDYVHSKGLKFGLYNCAGNKTCAGYPGSRGHEYQDALVYASLGADYLKYDWCNTDNLNAVGAYTTMRNALYTAGRPMVFSMCEWGSNKPWEWGADVGHLWRTTGDISASFIKDVDHGNWTSLSVMSIVNLHGNDNRKYAGPGHWNDPDMLEVGNGMSASEDRSHFALWCMMAAPLMMGNDLRKDTKETLATLTNKELIAIDQDKLGIQGFRYSKNDNLEIWLKPLSNDAWAILFLNTGDEARPMQYDWSQVISDDVSKRTFDATKTPYNVRDVIQHKDLGSTSKIWKTTIGSHDVMVVRLER